MSSQAAADGPFDLAATPVHLGLGATVAVQPTFTDRMEWYEAYGTRTESDGVEGRLVSLHTFTESWDITAGVGTEMRPH